MSPRENLLRTIRRDHPQWVPNDLESVTWLFPPVVERPWQKAGADDFGCLWEFEAGAEGGTYPAASGHPVKDLRQWRQQCRFPDLSKLDWSRVLRDNQRVDRREQLAMGFVEFGLFERTYMLLGMEEALVAFMTDAALVEELVAAIADYKIALIREFHRIARPEMIWYGDDWGTQSNLFLPPDVWRRIIKPHTQRIYDAIHGLGMLVNQHSCGKIQAVFADMVEMGADLWNPCQPCNDLAMLKRQFGGRISFCGGIDSQFVLNRPGVTAQEVRAEVRRRIDQLAPGGGYIAAPSHTVPYDKAVLEAMNDEISTYGRKFYAG